MLSVFLRCLKTRLGSLTTRRAEMGGKLIECLEPRVLLGAHPLPDLGELVDAANPVARVQTTAGAFDLELFLGGGAPGGDRSVGDAIVQDILDGRLDRSFVEVTGGWFTFGAGRFVLDHEGTLRVSDAPGGSGFSVIGRLLGAGDVLTDLIGAVSGAYASPPARVIDVELIKPEGTGMYTHVLAYPEGYRADTVSETIHLTNINATAIDYQVIARYERGIRDHVLAIGTLPGEALRSISLSDPALSMAPGDPLVPNSSRLPWKDRPYALEIHTTGVIGASFRHTDFDAEVGEDFFALIADGRFVISASVIDEWTLAGVGSSSAGVTRRSFLLLHNPTTQSKTVTVDLRSAGGGGPVGTRTVVLGPLRRGGLELFNLPEIPGGSTAISIFSTGAILAAISVYEQSTVGGGTPFLTRGAYGSMLSPGGDTFGIRGGLAGIQLGGPGENHITIVNPGPFVSPQFSAFGDLYFVTSSGDMLRRGFGSVFPDSWARVSLDSIRRALGLPIGEIVSVHYRSNVPVHMYYVSTVTDPTGARVGDTIATPFARYISGGYIFSGGGFDPDDPGQREVLSLYNEQRPGRDVLVSARALFSDGTSTGLAADVTLSAQTRLEFDLGTIGEFRSKLLASPGLTYSIEVTSRAAVAATWQPSILAQFTRFDLSEPTAYTTSGTLFRPGGMFGRIAHYPF